MKSKKNIAILLPVVLFIWGAVIYQFFSYSDSGEESQTIQASFELKPLKIKERDTFSIDIRYRDPFLGKMYTGQAKPTKGKISNAPKNKIIEVISWPPVVYKGIVSDTKNKNQVYMLIINGKTWLMKKGETQNDIFLKEGSRFSVTLKYRNEWKTLTLQS